MGGRGAESYNGSQSQWDTCDAEFDDEGHAWPYSTGANDVCVRHVRRDASGPGALACAMLLPMMQNQASVPCF